MVIIYGEIWHPVLAETSITMVKMEMMMTMITIKITKINLYTSHPTLCGMIKWQYPLIRKKIPAYKCKLSV